MSYTKLFFSIFFLLVSIPSFSQQGIVPYYARGIDYQKHQGYIILNDGEKIEGTFRYDPGELTKSNLKSFSENGKGLKLYKISNIKRVVLSGSDTTLSNKDSTYFEVFGRHKRFYRQLTFGCPKLYDNLFNVTEKKGIIGNFLYAMVNNQLREFDSKNKLINWMKTNFPDKVKSHTDIRIEQIIRQLNGVH